MIAGIGTDIIHIQRMRNIVSGPECPGFIEKTFTERELAQTDNGMEIVVFLATRFAAKEAVFKAFDGQWCKDDRLTDIEIVTGKNGEPQVNLSGRLQQLADKVFISLSYDGEYAIAFAVAISEDCK